MKTLITSVSIPGTFPPDHRAATGGTTGRDAPGVTIKGIAREGSEA